MEPNDFVRLRPRRDGALEVDVVALGDVVRIEAGAQFQEDHRGICNRSNQISPLERPTGFLKLLESVPRRVGAIHATYKENCENVSYG